MISSDAGTPWIDTPADASAIATGEAAAALPVYSIPQIADQLLTGYWASSGRAGFRWAPGNTDISFNVSGLTAERAQIARLAFATWSDVVGLRFSETTGAAEITLDDATPSSASASSSYSITGNAPYPITSARINVGANWHGGSSAVDSYTLQTFIHEIGHTLGLGHGGNYNGSATYGVSNHYANDTWQYSVMSYMSQQNYGGASYRFVMTPQMADVYAAQQYYGASTARASDTTYGFNASGLSGLTAQLYNFGNFTQAPALTIVDAGGIDTLDVSGYSSNQLINLSAGAWSNIGGLVGNIGIALGSTIERAVGGSGNDTIIGNHAANTLIGNGGNDQFTGGGGGDALDGGAGFDYARYDAAQAAVVARLDGGAQTGDALGDTFSSIEGLVGSNFGDFLAGDVAANVIYGLSGDDVLSGEGGNDVLQGDEGSDHLFGGAGADTVIGSAGIDYAHYDFATTAVVVRLGGGTQTGDAAGDTFSGIEGVVGSSFDDFVVGDGNANALYGIAGNDTIFGGGGNDFYLDGGEGADIVMGEDGDDVLLGGAGDDIWLDGGADNDSINGGLGNDLMIGGAGGDTFQYFSPAEGWDTIADFASGTDKLFFSQAAFGVLGGFIAGSTPSALNTAPHLIYNTSTGVLFYDADGTGAGSTTVIATLYGAPLLRFEDLMFG